MVATSFPEDEAPRQQINSGSGTFIGRDSYRYELTDEKTKAVLRKLAESTPALAKVVGKALNDGIISPDVVYGLELAARNINYDVAEALMIAGRNINMSVAETLSLAAQNINDETVRRFNCTATSVKQTIDEMSVPIGQLNSALAEISDEADRISQAVNSPPPVFVIDWPARLRWLVAGLIIGAVIVGYIAFNHPKFS